MSALVCWTLALYSSRALGSPALTFAAASLISASDFCMRSKRSSTDSACLLRPVFFPALLTALLYCWALLAELLMERCICAKVLSMRLPSAPTCCWSEDIALFISADPLPNPLLSSLVLMIMEPSALSAISTTPSPLPYSLSRALSLSRSAISSCDNLLWILQMSWLLFQNSRSLFSSFFPFAFFVRSCSTVA